MRFLYLFALLLGLTLLPGVALASSGLTPRLPLGGIWRGALPVPGGSLDVMVSVVPLAGGHYFAALDVPAQRIHRQVAELRVAGDSVTLWMPEAQGRFVAYFDSVRYTLHGVFTRPGLCAPLQLARGAMPSFDTPGTDDGNGPTLPYRAENVAFDNEVSRLRLGGTLTLPEGPGPFPAVVLVSDLGPHNRDGRVGNYRPLGALADYLTRQGVAVLRYDDRGVQESGGSEAAATPADRCADLQAALCYLRTRSELNPRQLGAIGHGEGANVSLLAAGLPLPPAFVVSLAGYGLPGQLTLLHQHVNHWRAEQLPPAEVQRRYEARRQLYDAVRRTVPQLVQPVVAGLLRQQQPGQQPHQQHEEAAAYAQPGLRGFLSFDPILHLDRVNCPVLLLHGKDDIDAAPRLHLRALRSELRSVHRRAITARQLPGLNHLFQPPRTSWTMLNGEFYPVFAPQAQESIRDWLTQILGPLMPSVSPVRQWTVETASN